MRKKTQNICFLLVMALILSCQTEKRNVVNDDEFVVSGSLPGLDVPFIFIDYSDEKTGDRVWDTVYVENESFSYKTKIKNTKRIAIWPLLARVDKNAPLGKAVSMGNSTRIEFLARPGDAIEFKGSVTEAFDAYPTGTDLCDDMLTYNNSIKVLQDKAADLQKKTYSLEQGSDAFKASYEEMVGVYDAITKKQVEFIRDNVNSEMSLFYLMNLLVRESVSEEEAGNLLANVNDELRSSPFYIDISTRIKGSEATKPGNPVPNVVTDRTLDGSTFDMASLKGKYVLIDFWGTWCGPCVEEMPTVKEYSEKYKDELVIVGINSGDTKQQIVDFIEPKGYDWVHLLSKKGVNDDNFVSAFNVVGFPTKFIIDREGIILHRFIGSAEAAFVKLDEILGE